MAKKILLANAHVPGIRSYEVYRREGGYRSVEKALKMQPLRMKFVCITRKISVAIFLISFAGCAGTIGIKNYAAEAKESKYDFFLELNDGNTIKYSQLEYKKLHVRLFGDGVKLPYSAGNIKAYQDKRAYRLRVTGYDSASVDDKYKHYDDFFAARLINGKIELFIFQPNIGYQPKNGAAGREVTLFIRKGKDSPPQGLDKGGVNLKLAISDNKDLKENFKEMYGRGRLRDIVKIIEEYN
jgi:hypothetical protein